MAFPLATLRPRRRLSRPTGVEGGRLDWEAEGLGELGYAVGGVAGIYESTHVSDESLAGREDKNGVAVDLLSVPYVALHMVAPVLAA